MEEAKALQKQVDEQMTTLKQGTARGLAYTQALLQDAHAAVEEQLDHAQGYVDSAIATARTVEDAAVSVIKGAVRYTAENPYTAYPAATTFALLALPGTRRLLWRYSLGRFFRPEAAVEKAGERVKKLKSQLPDYAAQVQKLEERLKLGEEELNEGIRKLTATRKELQRLGRIVSADHSVAQGLVRSLRGLNHVEGSLALRGEAASQAADLKAQLARINKGVYHIANKDI